MHPIQYQSNILLLADNFSAHQRGVEDALNRGHLRNARVAWLLANTSSLHQPIDRGIISNLKVFYKHHRFKFLANTFFHDCDPMTDHAASSCWLDDPGLAQSDQESNHRCLLGQITAIWPAKRTSCESAGLERIS